jgi:hypothetical protein
MGHGVPTYNVGDCGSKGALAATDVTEFVEEALAKCAPCP